MDCPPIRSSARSRPGASRSACGRACRATSDGRDPRRLGLRLAAARHRALAQRAADGPQPAAGGDRRHRAPDRAAAVERHGDDQALPRHRHADAAHSVRRRPRRKRRRPSRRRATRRSGVRGFASASRASRFGRVKDYFKRYEEEHLRAGADRDARWRSTISRRSPRSRASTACSSARATSRRAWALGRRSAPGGAGAIADAIERIKACGKAPGILTPDEKQARRYIELGTVFTAVGADLGLLARGSPKRFSRSLQELAAR